MHPVTWESPPGFKCQTQSTSGELENWRTGELENWRTGELENWRTGELENWRTGELENSYLPGQLEHSIGEFVANITPADVYFGKAPAILEQRENIKRKTIEQRGRLHQEAITA